MFQYIAFVITQTLIRIIPFWAMYGLCYVNGLIIQYILRYRIKVVSNNLHNSFPEKSKKEINKIKRQFYQYFAEMLFEAGKGYNMPRRKLEKRYKVNNPGLMEEYYNQGKSVILDMAHFNNWEWTTGVFGEIFRHKVFAIYKPLKNKKIDEYVRKSRERRNYHLVPMKNTGLMFRNITHQPCAFVMISDQSPTQLDKAHWIDFLNRTTGFLHGPETYARKFGLAVVFAQVLKIKQGYYEINLIPIADTANDLPEGHITMRYAQLLEETIKMQTSRWLWSHRRWKKTKPENKETINISK